MKTYLSILGILLAGLNGSLGAPSVNQGRVPLHFERNDGQADRSGDFLAHEPGYRLFLRSTGMTLDPLSGLFKTVKLKLGIPKGVDLSGKFLIAVIDYDGQVDESDEDNNAAAFGPVP